MANAGIDENDGRSLIAVSSTDGTSLVRLWADPITHRLLVDIAGGAGDVDGPASSTDNAVARFDGTTGKIIQNSGVIVDDSNNVTGVATLTASGALRSNTSLILEETGAGTDIITIHAPASIATGWDFTLPPDDGTSGQFLQTDGNGVSIWASASGGLVVGTTTITSGTTTRILYDNAGVVGEYTLTGTGTVVVMQTSPTLVTPVLGVATATSINKVAFTAPATNATLTIAEGKTLTASNTLTFTGTDASSVAFGTGGTVLYTASTIPLTVGSTTIASGTTTRILYDNAGVLGEYTLTGSGTVAVMQTSPTLVTPVLGVATATSINKMAITAPATSSTLAVADGKTATHSATTTFAGTDGKTLTISNSGTLGGGDAFVLAIAASKTLTVSNTMTLAGGDSTSITFPNAAATMARTDAANTFTGASTATSWVLTTPLLGTPTSGVLTNCTGLPAASVVAGTLGSGTFTATQLNLTANPITASSNAATVPITSGRNLVTNNSAAGLTITMTTTSAVSMQMCVVQILPSSAVAQTLTFVGTENSAATSVPANTGSSTTIPISVGFIFNAGTSKWTCVASS